MLHSMNLLLFISTNQHRRELKGSAMRTFLFQMPRLKIISVSMHVGLISLLIAFLLKAEGNDDHVHVTGFIIIMSP